MEIKQQIKQLWNEKRKVTFLFVELLLVFIILWYILSWSYEKLVNYMEPVGFDITDTYLITLNKKNDNSIDFIPESDKETTLGEDMLEIANRLKRLPQVEYVSISILSRPYTWNNSGVSFSIDSLNLHALRRQVTPDFFNVFRYRNQEEKVGYSLADALEGNKVIVGENILPDEYKKMNLKGKILYETNDSTKRYEIGAVTQKVRYTDYYHIHYDKYVAFELSEQALAKLDSRIFWIELCVRVKPEISEDFPQYIMTLSDRNLNVGNLFIQSVKSYENIRTEFLLEDINAIKTRMWMLGFLLINIFLGIIGTFWFRTQHRKSEMALRVAVGATRKGLWSYLNMEGILLLIMASLPGIVICYSIGKAGLATDTWSISGFIVCIVFTYLLIGLMILAGISYPAYQVMKSKPAIALREE